MMLFLWPGRHRLMAQLYQSIVSPAPAIAEIVTVPAAHLELPAPVGAFGEGFTTSVTEHEL
jgi:hypothetical protein